MIEWLSDFSYPYFTSLNLVDLNILIIFILTMIVFVNDDNEYNNTQDDSFTWYYDDVMLLYIF